MTLRLFDDDPYLLAFEARVVAAAEHQGRPAVVLDRTAFYAESGGQPWDLGTLDGVPVTAVIEDGGRLLHVLERPLPRAADGAPVRGRVDGERRRDHRQQHHGQHLLSRAFVEIFGVRTQGFHLGSEVVTIDLERAVTADEVRLALARANEIVQEARPVRVRSVARDEAVALGHAVPPEAGEIVRLVEAQGFDHQPCSGTHPRTTAEVGPIVALRSERFKGATRLHFACGRRALLAVQARLAALDELGALLSAPPDAVAGAARQALAELAAARKRGDELLARALRFEARQLLAGATDGHDGRPLVVVKLEPRPPAEVRALALETTTLAPCTVLLGAPGDEAAALVFARSPGGSADLGAALRAALAVVGGRGGGRGDVVQGGGPAVARLDEALGAARAALAAGPG